MVPASRGTTRGDRVLGRRSVVFGTTFMNSLCHGQRVESSGSWEKMPLHGHGRAW